MGITSSTKEASVSTIPCGGSFSVTLALTAAPDIMSNPNWTVRLKNKTFWLALIPAVLLLVQVVAAVFGYTLDLGDLGNKLLEVVNALFAVLAILGIVTDPTTAGVTDSKQALTYTEPKKKDAD